MYGPIISRMHFFWIDDFQSPIIATCVRVLPICMILCLLASKRCAVNRIMQTWSTRETLCRCDMFVHLTIAVRCFISWLLKPTSTRALSNHRCNLGCGHAEMGLGKTLQALMLTAAHPAGDDWVQDISCPDYTEENPCNIKTTLVVAPWNLISQWKSEAERHLKPGELKIGIFEGMD